MRNERNSPLESGGITDLPVKEILHFSTGEFNGIVLLPNFILYSRALTLRQYPAIKVSKDGNVFHTGPSPLEDTSGWELGQELPEYKGLLPPGTYLVFNHAVQDNFG